MARPAHLLCWTLCSAGCGDTIVVEEGSELEPVDRCYGFFSRSGLFEVSFRHTGFKFIHKELPPLEALTGLQITPTSCTSFQSNRLVSVAVK